MRCLDFLCEFVILPVSFPSVVCAHCRVPEIAIKKCSGPVPARSGRNYAPTPSIGDFLKGNNPVGKVCLIVDQDMGQGLECRLTDRLKSLTTSFSNEQVTLAAFKTHDSLHKSCISRKSKKIQLGFTEVKPSLESIISRFLRSYCRIPQDQISGNEHETIRMACTYLDLDGKQNLFAHFANDYPSQLKTEMTRTELKQTVCFLL